MNAADFEPLIGQAVVVRLDGGAIGPNGTAVVHAVDSHFLTLRIGKGGTLQPVRLASIVGMSVFPPAPAGTR